MVSREPISISTQHQPHPKSTCTCFHIMPTPGSTEGGESPSQPIFLMVQHHFFLEGDLEKDRLDSIHLGLSANLGSPKTDSSSFLATPRAFLLGLSRTSSGSDQILSIFISCLAFPHPIPTRRGRSCCRPHGNRRLHSWRPSAPCSQLLRWSRRDT